MAVETGTRDLFAGAIERFGALVHEVPADAWTAPTPCSEWDVRALVHHLMVEISWTVPLLGGRSVADVGDSLNSALLRTSRRVLKMRPQRRRSRRSTRTGRWSSSIRLSRRDVSGADYTSRCSTTSPIHGWDLARAIGADETVDPRFVAIIAERTEPVIADLRASGQYGDEVVPPDGADAQTRLLAMFGRVA